MKLRLLIVPVLMTAVAFGQGGRFAGGGANANSGTPPTFTPPTAAQLAAAQLTQVARFLRLNSADTALVVGNAALVSDIEMEQTALQTQAAALKTANTNLANAIPSGGGSAAEGAVNTANAAILDARVKAATSVVTALPTLHLSVTLTSAQLTSVGRFMVGAGGGGFAGPGFGRPGFGRYAPAAGN